MKRHLTVLASTAMLAAFAGMAMAADAPAAAPAEAVAVTPAVVVAAPVVVAPVVVAAPAVVAPAPAPTPSFKLGTMIGSEATSVQLYVSGTYETTVEYNALTKAWDGAEKGLTGDAGAKLNIEVPATATLPKLNVTYDFMGTGHAYGDVTVAGDIFGGTLKLGNVEGNYDNYIASGTDGAGAKFTKSFGPVSFDVFTTKTGKTIGDGKFSYSVKEEYLPYVLNDAKTAYVAPTLTSSQVLLETVTMDGQTYSKVRTSTKTEGSIALNATGAKAAIDLGNGNNLAGMLVVSQEKTGGALVTGTYKAGMATLTGKYGVSLDPGKTNTGKAVNGKVELKPFDALTLSAEGWQIDSTFSPVWEERDPGAKGDNTYGEAYWWQKYGYANKLNYKLRADFTLVKDVASVYGEYFDFANINDDDYTKVGGSNKDLWLSDAYAKFQNTQNEYNAKFEKSLGGVAYTLEGGFRTKTAGTDEKKGYIKAEKTFGWLKTWVYFGSDFAADYKPAPKVGAYVKVQF